MFQFSSDMKACEVLAYHEDHGSFAVSPWGKQKQMSLDGGQVKSSPSIRVSPPLLMATNNRKCESKTQQTKLLENTMVAETHPSEQDAEPHLVSFNTLVSLLKLCSNSKNLTQGRILHIHIIKHGLDCNNTVVSSLIKMYGICGKMNDAQAVFDVLPYANLYAWNILLHAYAQNGFLQEASITFDKMPKKDVVSWSAMIAACSQNEHSHVALKLFYQMQDEGIKPNNITFVGTLDACMRVASLDEGQKIHAAVVNSGCEQDTVVGNVLINMYSKCGKLDFALLMFFKMHDRDVVSWSTAIAAYIENDHSKEALHLFHEMQHDGVRPDKVAFICALDACSDVSALKEGRDIYESIRQLGHEGDNVVATALINMFGKCGDLKNARKMFGRMSQRDVVAWSAMIAACICNGHAEEGLNLFDQMQLLGVVPNKVAFIECLDACASLAALEEGHEIHASLVAYGYDDEVAMGNAIINMYGKCASLHAARSVFGRLTQRNIVSWNSMMASYAQSGHNKGILDLFQQMLLDGVKPDEITFIAVLTACNHTGQVDDARHIFVSMKEDYGITHSEGHYMCMIDLLGRAGHLNEAEDLIKLMPFHETSLAWLSLLGACKVHGDLERGLRAAKHLMKLDPNSASPYVTMWNLYSKSTNLIYCEGIG